MVIHHDELFDLGLLQISSLYFNFSLITAKNIHTRYHKLGIIHCIIYNSLWIERTVWEPFGKCVNFKGLALILESKM